MRQVKFRGKRIDNGEWVYGGYCYFDFQQDGKRIISHEISTIDCDTIPVVPATIGQYCGVNDLYEGDIVSDGVRRYEIEWDERNCRFSLRIIENPPGEGIRQTHEVFPIDGCTLKKITSIHEQS